MNILRNSVNLSNTKSDNLRTMTENQNNGATVWPAIRSLTGSNKRRECRTIHPNKLTIILPDWLFQQKTHVLTHQLSQHSVVNLRILPNFVFLKCKQMTPLITFWNLRTKSLVVLMASAPNFWNYQLHALLNILRTYIIYSWITVTFRLLLSTLKWFHFTKRVILVTSTISDSFR